MFGKKTKLTGLTVMHYEGLPGFSQDFPCSIEQDDCKLTFKRVNPEATATIQKDQITDVDILEERQFMHQYHNDPTRTAKLGAKWFLVIKYTSASGDPKHLAFWNTGTKGFSEIRNCVSIQTVAL